MPNQILTWEQVQEEAQKALNANMPQGQWHYHHAGERCALMPSEAHCWHQTSVVWDDLFPPPLVCCWCNAETFDLGAVPHRHGPYAEGSA